MAKAKKTKGETNKAVGPQVQPEPIQNEGVDPLTAGNTLYPREDVKGSAVEADDTPQNHQALPASEVPNSDTEEQDAVAEGRTE